MSAFLAPNSAAAIANPYETPTSRCELPPSPAAPDIFSAYFDSLLFLFLCAFGICMMLWGLNSFIAFFASLNVNEFACYLTHNKPQPD